MELILLYLILINAAGLVLMLIDKRRAVKNLWRIPERTLLLLSLAGGCVGTLLGMRLFRHKTKKPAFSIGIPVMFALWVIFAIFLMFLPRIV
jgi:uncharacterized membrane protein YsdA (DUF1294 family)